MSDEFDKEAEKRKLREKYAEEQKDREATGRMSDLLLQGATMTNKHCGTCGSPIFRYQGQSFCPTCQAEGREDAQKDIESEQQTEQPTEAAASTTDEAVEPTTTRTPERGSQQPQTAGERANAATPATRETPESHAQTQESGDLDDARAALADTITTLARRAGNADDPRHARDLLAAAKEAAETLDTLH